MGKTLKQTFLHSSLWQNNEYQEKKTTARVFLWFANMANLTPGLGARDPLETSQVQPTTHTETTFLLSS